MDNLKELRVPDLGGAHDVPVIEWLVKVGDRVAIDQGVITLESDKATIEVPSSVAGIVRELKARLGDTLSEGNLIALIEVKDATADIATPVTDSMQSRAADDIPLIKRVAVAIAEPAEEPCIDNNEAGSRSEPTFDSPGDAPYASPAVRQLARVLGVALSQVKGSGRKGRIVRGDLETHARTTLPVDDRRVETTGSDARGGPIFCPGQASTLPSLALSKRNRSAMSREYLELMFPETGWSSRMSPSTTKPKSQSSKHSAHNSIGRRTRMAPKSPCWRS